MGASPGCLRAFLRCVNISLHRFKTRTRMFAAVAVAVLLGLSLIGTKARASEMDDDWATLREILANIKGVATTPIKEVVSDRYTSGMLLGNGDIGVVVGDTVSTQRFYFGKNDFWGTATDSAHPEYNPGIISLGGLTVSSPTPGSHPESVYRMEQDILNAQVTTAMQFGNTTVHMRSWTADSDNVFVTEFSSDSNSEPVTISLDLWQPANKVYPYASGVSDGVLWVSRANNLSGANEYVARAGIALRLLGTSFDSTQNEPAGEQGTFTLKPNAPVQVVMTFRGDARIGPDGPSTDALAQKAREAVSQLKGADIAAMWSDHLEQWKKFWLRSYIQVHDSVLENYYYGALYLLGSTTRPEKALQTSMWGNFITMDTSRWGGRYFDNYNVEAPYYGIFSANRPDWILPYTNFLFAEEPFQQNITAAAGYKGVAYSRSFPPFDQFRARPAEVPIAPAKDYTKFTSTHDQKSNGTFLTIPAIWYWEYTLDMGYLRKRLYPQLKALDAFWRDFMVWDGKRYVVDHSSAHEGKPIDVNPNLDLGFIRKIENTLLQTSAVLGIDAELRPVWNDTLKKLSDYPTGTVDGAEVYYTAEVVNNGQQQKFEPGGQPINMEGTVFPGENLAIGGDAKQLKIALNSLEKMNSWGSTPGSNSTNGFQKEFPIAARVGWPALDLVNKFKAAILYHWRESNLTVGHRSGGIETAGSMECLDSMLLQHELGVLRVFPVWPTSMDASFKRLRAKGAFVVSSEIKNGAVTYVDILSEKGGSLTVQNPWEGKKPKIERVDATTKRGLGSIRYKESDGELMFETKPGERYLLTSH